MTNATVLRIGQDNSAGDTKALFLKVFSGEVLNAFNTANKVLDKHVVRSIPSGKSAQFPATWKVTAQYHVVGTELVGQAANLSERVITIDDLLVADVFMALIEEAMNHYDVRREYSKQTGIALSNQMDRNVFQTALLAARASATITGAFGGTSIIDADADTNSASLAASIFTAAQNLDEKDVPDEDRWCFVRPAQYYILAQDTTAINRDFRGAGSYADGKIIAVAGFPIIKTNQLPNSNVVSGPAKYQGDFSQVVSLLMQRSAVGTVKLLNMVTEMAYDIRRQGTLMVSKHALGHGILRPESSVEIILA